MKKRTNDHAHPSKVEGYKNKRRLLHGHYLFVVGRILKESKVIYYHKTCLPELYLIPLCTTKRKQQSFMKHLSNKGNFLQQKEKILHNV